MGQMDFTTIRQAISEKMGVLVHPITNDGLPELCRAIGLADVSSEAVSPLQDIGVTGDEGRGEIEKKFADHFSRKLAYVAHALDATRDDDLPEVAQRMLEMQGLFDSRERNALQDLVWPEAAPVSKRVRHQIARELDIHSLFVNSKEFDVLIDELFILDDGLPIRTGLGNDSLRVRINQHVHRNRGDWSVEELFEKLGAFEVTDCRFIRFLEGLVSPEVQPETEQQLAVVESVNRALGDSGLEIAKTGERDGYPVFTVVSPHSTVAARPKNLIFASFEKPDLRLSDAIANDVEIVTNADRVLVYDRPISGEGLTWSDLQDWWKDNQGIDDDDVAKNALYNRLRSSLPESSPPQLLFFDAYHKYFGTRIPRLPALLPEVWFHWDPKTAKQRGTEALFRSRMDFLMLLPGRVGVVLEVDGVQHYSSNGKPDPKLYAKMAAADRQLKLDGYHVFRFGGAELGEAGGQTLAEEFFESLFLHFGIQT